MEKLFNWTIGSFFRTIGRIIAYFAIGAIIAYILSNSNIKLPRITNLFFTKVKASTIVPVAQPTYYINAGTNSVAYSSYYDMYINYNADRINYFTFQSGAYTSATEGVLVPNGAYKINLRGIFEYESSWHDLECMDWDSTTGLCDSYDTTNVALSLQIGSLGPVSSCQMNSLSSGIGNGNDIYFTASCPVPTNMKYLNYVRFNFNNVSNKTSLYVGVYLESWEISDGQAIIDNQNQNHNETMTVIYDTNTTQEQNEITTLFEDFQFSSESSGLVGVITSPLRVINAISQGSFSDLCFTLKNKNVCLPNGNIIWQKSSRTSIKGITPNWFGSGSISIGIQSFVTLFNLVVGGFLFYKMGCSIKRMVEELINPTDTRIEVMKL